MNGTTLPNGRSRTTSLGLGCAYLVSGLEKNKNKRLVHAAYDSGVRHFDVAPSYGMGTAEDVLGEALEERRDKVTVATKVGIAWPKTRPSILLARALAAPIRRLVPSLTRRVGANVVAARGVVRGCFDLNFVEKSLAESLRRLRTDYVDLYLLHEARAADISDELLTFLDKRRQEGVVLALGVASAYDDAVEIAKTHGAFFDAFQYSWSVLDENQSRPEGARFIVTHRALYRALEPLHAWFAADPSARARLAMSTRIDLSDERMLSLVLIGAALAANSDGIVLVASRRIPRVISNAQAASNTKWIDAGRLFMNALAAESQRPRPG